MLEVDPNYMEKQVIIPIEGAVGTLMGVDRVRQVVEREIVNKL